MLHLLSTGRTPECVLWTSFRGSRCSISRLSWSMAPMSSKSTRKRNSAESPKQSLRTYWRRVHLAGTSSFSRTRAFVAAPVAMFVWTGSFCLAGIELFTCFRRGTVFPVCMTPLRACSLTIFSLDLSCPCVDVPFLWWPNLTFGLDGFFHQDRVRCPGNVLSGPGVLQSVRRWKTGISSSLPAQEASFLTCRHLPAKELRICTWNTHGYWVLPRRARDHVEINGSISEEWMKSPTSCAQETHCRLEHLANIDIVLDWAIWMKFGTGNVNSGGSVFLARFDPTTWATSSLAWRGEFVLRLPSLMLIKANAMQDSSLTSPNSWTSTRKRGEDFQGWAHVDDGETKAGWGAVVRFMCVCFVMYGPVVTNIVHPA